MYYCYGQVRSQNGSSPAAFDPGPGYTVFTAGECPVEIVSGSYYGGVADNYYHLMTVPPSFTSGSLITGTTGASMLTRILNAGSAASTPFTENLQGNVLETERLYSTRTKWIIPPYHSVVIVTQASANAVITINLTGMDLVEPGSKAY